MNKFQTFYKDYKCNPKLFGCIVFILMANQY